ncbi:MAG: MATE family efflux transporter, partial [Acutalibacteraceae bacterium]
LCLIRLLLMRDVLHVRLRSLWPSRALLSQLVRLGLPSGLTQAIFSMAMIVVQSLTNSFGTTIIAVSTVVMRVDGFAMMPNFTFGTAMTTFTGQNIGAKQLERVEKGTKSGMKIGIAVSAILVVLILLFGRFLVEMFTTTPDVIRLSVHMMRILAVGYVAMAVTQILSGVMRGAGDTMTPMWISMITTIIIRVPIAYGLAALMQSPDALFISMLTSWVMGAVLTVIAYRMGRWKKKSIIGSASA